MRFTSIHQLHMPLKALALSAALLVMAPSQAALSTVTLDSGLQVNQDDGSGLLWHAFDAPATGEQAGFRAASAREFASYLVSAGYGLNGDGSWFRVGKPVLAVPGLDLYTNDANNLSWLGLHNAAYFGWVDSQGGRQLVSMSDDLSTTCDATRYCVSTTTSTAKFGDLASALGQTFVPSATYMWKDGASNVITTPDAPNFIMVRAAVPEPASYALMGLGLVGLAWVGSRRSQLRS